MDQVVLRMFPNVSNMSFLYFLFLLIYLLLFILQRRHLIDKNTWKRYKRSGTFIRDKRRCYEMTLQGGPEGPSTSNNLSVAPAQIANIDDEVFVGSINHREERFSNMNINIEDESFCLIHLLKMMIILI